jgi:hypothetical protein
MFPLVHWTMSSSFVPSDSPAKPARPKWLELSVAGVIGVAAFQVLGGLSTWLTFFMSRHHPLARMAGTAPEAARMLALQQRMMAGPAPLLTCVVGAAGVFAGAWGLYCAIRALSSKPGARMPFRRAVVGLLLVESVTFVTSVWLQMWTLEVFGELTKEVSSVPGAMQAMQGFAILSVVVMVGWEIAKVGALGWAHRYTGTRDVVDYLDR